MRILDKEPSSKWPQLEISYCRRGVPIFVSSNSETRARLTKTVAKLRPLGGCNLNVSGDGYTLRDSEVYVLDFGKTGRPGCRPLASGGVQSLAKNSILGIF